MKNETKHTPKPWTTSGIAGDNHVMGLPALHQPCARVTVAIVPGWQGITFEEHEANKRLIAAAPDLLAALRDLVAIMAELHPDADNLGGLESARAAIARAERGNE